MIVYKKSRKGNFIHKYDLLGNFLVVRWLRCHTSTAKGAGIPLSPASALSLNSFQSSALYTTLLGPFTWPPAVLCYVSGQE